jgi:hypothetical protein
MLQIVTGLYLLISKVKSTLDMMTGITDLERQSLHFLALVEVYLPKNVSRIFSKTSTLITLIPWM